MAKLNPSTETVHGCLWLLISRDHPQTLPQAIVQRYGTPLLAQEITEGFVGDALEWLAGFKAEMLQRVPHAVVELDAAADGHQ